MNDKVRVALVTSGGLGLLRPAPGTWGSLPPAVLAWVLLLRGESTSTIAVAVLTLGVLAGIVCAALGGWAERHFGKKDPSSVVADETCGQSLSLVFWPLAWTTRCKVENWSNWAHDPGFWRASLSVAGAFVAFRVADIIKPPPARGLERLPGGIGVLLDDVAAGLYAALVVQVALRLL